MSKGYTPSKWACCHVVILLLLLACTIGFSGSTYPLRVELQYSVFDQFNKWYPREPTEKVIIVDIDEASLQRYGQWPWPRKIMAELVVSLTEKGAKAIAFDGVFSDEDRSSPHYFLSHLSGEEAKILHASDLERAAHFDYDFMFSKAIKDSKIFVTAFTYGSSERANNTPLNKNKMLVRDDVKSVFLENAYAFHGASINLEQFSNNAAGNGSFMARLDSDGVLRRAGMVFTDGKTLYPSLSLEALRVALIGGEGIARLASTPEEARHFLDTNYRISLGNMAIPVEADGVLNVYYRNFCNAQDIKNTPELCLGEDYVSAYKFLDPAFTDKMQDNVKGKIILIGASAEGLKNLRNTPLRSFRPEVEVHANVIEQVLSGDYLLRPSIVNGVEAIFILVSGLFFVLLSQFVGIIVSILLCITIVSVAMFGAFWMYVDYGLLFDPVYPSVAVVFIFTVSAMLSYARTERKRKRIRNAFGMYVAPDVMRDLEAYPERITLGGESRDITVMFTDIRKFTTISEELSPKDLIQLMNDFLTGMTDIVMAHQGTVDKYIGDAMMAFWNAPRDIENHEREACLAALQMQSKLEPINERIRIRAQEKGQKPFLLLAGIGIHTGICAVGNMGSKQRFAYSALGDAVNLAARLEGQTKAYGVSIMVGESTYEKACDLAMLELDLIRVVGRTAPVRIYGLMGDYLFAQSSDFQEWHALHMQMLSCYRARDFKGAQDLLPSCQEKASGGADGLYQTYAARIEALMEVDLPDDWDGVYTAESK